MTDRRTEPRSDGKVETRSPIGLQGNQRCGTHWSWVALLGVLLVAGHLRFSRLNWDEGQYIHPDEGHMRNTVSLIRWPDDLSLYFDTHRSPLNVRNTGHQYSYGTLPLFLTRVVAEQLDEACMNPSGALVTRAASAVVHAAVGECGPGSFTGAHSAVVGRALSGLADLGTLVLVYLSGRRLYGEATGLVAASFGAVTAFLIQQAHFFTVDSMACFFTMLVAYSSVRAGQMGKWRDFALAGLGLGLGAACKVSAATGAVLVVLAVAWRFTRTSHRETRCQRLSSGDSPRLWRVLLCLCLAAVVSVVAFRVAQPYTFEGPGFLGVNPDPEWFRRLGEIRAEQSGDVDIPSGRQWTNRSPIVFPWVNIVVWGMGLPLGLAAWIGWGVAGFELVSGSPGGRKHIVLWGWTTALFLYQGTQWVKTMRYFLPLYPILGLFAAYWLVRLARSTSHWWRSVGLTLLSLVSLGAVFWGLAFFAIYLRPHPRVAASRWIFEHVPEGVTVANEHWDWGLPLRIDGHDPFGGLYNGIEMRNYDEDTSQKRQRLHTWLDQADYIFLASNRLYASIPRLPARYPLTTEYYRALFAGELGFRLEADFASYPALGPFVFPDQETPFELSEADYVSQSRPIEVRLPPAEEAFSVYDHPRVLIFRKTEAYSQEHVRQVLGAVDLERAVVGRTPREATRAPDMLRFDDDTWADQQSGGTWSDMFNREGVLNRYPGLAAVAWWVAVAVLGWLTFPIVFAALPRLRDRGYGFARVLGMLLVAYLVWLAASLRVFPNTRPTIWRMIAVLGLVGGGVAWLRWDELREFAHSRWRTLVTMEGLFALLFAAWTGVRLIQPDLWHPVVGGEKPMDFAYLNAVMKSTWFPPYTPWLSGTWINYYYFGFVIVGTLIKLVGTVPAIAYNLAVPLIFALTGLGAFSVAYNLSRGNRRHWLLAGAGAAVCTVLLGNLGVVHLLRNKLIALGDVSFPSTIPGFPNTVALIHGLWRVVVRGTTLSMRPESWYWHPTRIIPSEAGNPIAEFPAFTFLYADLHAHMIALPLTLCALALGVYWARTANPGWGSLLLGGLVIGALRPTNTWDYATYLGLGLASLGLGARRLGRRSGAGAAQDAGSEGRSGVRGKARVSWLKSLGWRLATLVLLTVLLYVPYIRYHVAGYTSFELWKGQTTPVQVYLWIHAILLFPVVTDLVFEALESARSRSLAGLAIAGALACGVSLAILGYGVALVAVPIGALCALLLLMAGRRALQGSGASDRLLWLMVGVAMALSLSVEVVVLKGDIGRMNTVFKFYLQVWVLLSIAAAIGLSRVWERAREWRPRIRQMWWGAMGVLALGGALFLPFGLRARGADRIAPEVGLTLNGMAFMRHAVIADGREGDLREISLSGDYSAIRWMQENIKGSPVILEGLGRREYLWANRVSIYTGLPAVAGWRHHQAQQRAGVGGEMVNWRRDDADACYSTTDIAQADEILDRYDVGYIYLGEYERAYYNERGLDKFDQMVEDGLLRLVYDAGGVAIYEVVS